MHPTPSHVLAIAILAGTLLSAKSSAQADQLIPSTVLPAPVGHFQPRAKGFVAKSEADKTEQQQLHMFDAQQRQLDKELDQKLNVCRC